MKQIIRRVAALVIGLGLSAVAIAGLESVTHISDLNASWPLGSDLASTSDDHIRNIKTALKTDFPNITGPVTATQTQINSLIAAVTGTANPSASAGLSAVNGSSTTCMRSDGAPAISQSISPTWSGTHTFSNAITVNSSSSSLKGLVTIATPSGGTSLKVNGVTGNSGFTGNSPFTVTIGPSGADSTDYFGIDFTDSSVPKARIGTIFGGSGSSVIIGTSNNYTTGITNSAFTIGPSGNITIAAPAAGSVALSMTGVANSNTLSVNAPNTSSQSFGVAVGAGTNSSDYAALIQSAAGTSYFKIRGDGQISAIGPVNGSLVDMTPDTSTFTATYTGFTAGVTCTATWSRVGKLVTLFFCAATGTSNATSFTMTGLPSAIQPASLTQTVALPIGPVQNSGIIDTTVSATVTAASGTVTFLHNGSSSGWTSSSTKGFSSGATISYLLN